MEVDSKKKIEELKKENEQLLKSLDNNKKGKKALIIIICLILFVAVVIVAIKFKENYDYKHMPIDDKLNMLGYKLYYFDVNTNIMDENGNCYKWNNQKKKIEVKCNMIYKEEEYTSIKIVNHDDINNVVVSYDDSINVYIDDYPSFYEKTAIDKEKFEDYLKNKKKYINKYKEEIKKLNEDSKILYETLLNQYEEYGWKLISIKSEIGGKKILFYNQEENVHYYFYYFLDNDGMSVWYKDNLTGDLYNELSMYSNGAIVTSYFKGDWVCRRDYEIENNEKKVTREMHSFGLTSSSSIDNCYKSLNDTYLKCLDFQMKTERTDELRFIGKYVSENKISVEEKNK